MPAVNARALSARALMLACKATTCNWDVFGSTMYVGQGRTGRSIWIQTIRCLRCGSTRTAHYPPRHTRTADRIGGYHYDRPPGWADIRVYYGDAMQALVDEGLLQLGAAPVAELKNSE
jgi:hypothetical protein